MSAKELSDKYITELQQKLTKIADAWPTFIKFNPAFMVAYLSEQYLPQRKTLDEINTIACMVNDSPDDPYDQDDIFWNEYSQLMTEAESFWQYKQQETGGEEDDELGDIVKTLTMLHQRHKKPLTKFDIRRAVSQRNPRWATDEKIIGGVSQALTAAGVKMV